MPFAAGPVLMYVGRGIYETIGPTEYVGSDDVISVPAGFRSDLATVPRAFWALLPPGGVYEQAAVVHDWNCTRLAAGDCAVSSRDADGLFRRMAREGGAGLLTRWALWTGVRWGALFNPHRRAGWLRDAPAVLAITVAGLAAVCALVYGVDHGVHALLRLV